MEEIQAQNLPDEVSKDVFLVYTDSGRTKFTLEAPIIHKYTKDTNYTEFPEGVDAVFYNKYGQQTSKGRSGYALKIKQDDEVIFRDSVRFENYKGEVLRSEEIYLINDTIYSDTTVFIETPNLILEGIGLTAPKDFSTYTLLKPVGVYNVPPNKE